MIDLPTVMPPRQELPTVGLATLQTSWGGLCDASPTADNYAVHLVRVTERGTPGPTLCGIDRFADDAPGWSVGGGVTGPNVTHNPCQGCADAARRHFRDVPIRGLGTPQIVAAIAGTENA
jgi:hypothetical protein